MATVKMSQKEYLKKYIGGGADLKKKKKKKLKVGQKTVKIIDDDVDISNLRPLENGELDIFNANEDAPQIAGIIDERGPVDFTDKRRWRIIVEDGDVAVSLGNNHSEVPSTPSKQSEKNEERDTSPPRKTQKKHEDNDSDIDLPRTKKRHSEQHRQSRKHHSSESDLSPPRKSQKKRKGSDSDLDLPRSTKKHSDQHQQSRKYHNSDSDLSPPRKTKKKYHDSDSDMDVPRPSKRHQDHRQSRRRHSSDTDLSPPRKSKTESRTQRKHRDSDSSSRISKRDRERSPRRKPSRWNDSRSRKSSSPTDELMKKTLDGKTAGLQLAKGMREELIEHKKRETERRKEMDVRSGGPPQYAIVRKNGRRRRFEEDEAEREEKEKRQAELDAKYAKWGKGLKQCDDRAEKLASDAYEMTKPLARYANDEDLDAQRRLIEYDDDPMLQYIKEKQIREGKRKPDRPSYQGSFMPNRFGIKPGQRWDGVDRSNGYEKKWFEAKNARTAIQEEAYKWSTADM